MISASDINRVRTGPRGGVPIIFVHAVGIDLTYWGEYIESFRAEYDVTAFDLPGHGRSPGSAADWTLQNAAALLAGIVRSTSDGPAHIVGLSVGGMIAQAFAIGHPDLAASLTLIDTAATFADEGRAVMRARADLARRDGMAAVIPTTLERWFTERTRRERPDIIDRVKKSYLGDDATIHAAIWNMIAELDLVDQLGFIRCPALILVGQFDPSSPPSAAQLLADHIADARMYVIEDASHMAPLEKPDVVKVHLKAFLAEQSALKSSKR